MEEQDNDVSDKIDVKKIFGKFMPKLGKPRIPELQGSFKSEEYSLNYNNKGKCYIFNHKEFQPHLKAKEREGTDKDASSLEYTFTNLGFATKIFPDFTVREIHKKLKEASEEDHTDNSCFVCCILTHGDRGILLARDGKYLTEEVFKPFHGNNCHPSLVGKPKLFFIQACQGDKEDKGVLVKFKESTDQESCSLFKIPAQADFLVAYSSVPGFTSARNTTYGSWFIQALCAVLQECAETKDIVQILTIVNRKVAYEFGFERKQMPFITSTLTRDLKFF